MDTSFLDTLSRDETGSYVLFTKLSEGMTISIGRSGPHSFPRGYYAYVGSAMNGLKSRLSRHLRADKRLHWHIDYLLTVCPINVIIIVRNTDRVECSIAKKLGKLYETIPGFGSSDCRCSGHLFYQENVMQWDVLDVLREDGYDAVPYGRMEAG